MDAASLQKEFGLPGVLTFDTQNGLVRADVRTAAANGSFFLQGAHLTGWQPIGFEPVIFLSRKSEFAPGRPIRGGVPIAFPWFATDQKPDRIDGHPGPSHGFARIQDWTMLSAEREGEGLRVALELGPTAMSRSMGFDRFHLGVEMSFQKRLTMRMTVKNNDQQPLRFEEAFHTYYTVTDVHEATLNGLEPTGYIDKTDGFKQKPASGVPLTFTRTLDRMYNNTSAPCVIHDGAGKRRITLRKTGSNTTVVWNPWNELPDLGPWEWHEMLAVETVNAGVNAVTLAPGASWMMESEISVEKV